ncbi:MAG: hypothetical protein KF909_11280 [Rhodocyclaceae bacterium]|nr:hypothetical protein [Thauera sp.]MBX3686710.1 hypothetical protein [Rhodocyclaceae bacterium]MCP5231291.1 hypothetical protein [Zoogloeaceae bacterium]MCB1911157.1 hypothetical protein [Rhodocyclaceae bacterium]MCP5241485.1 hypothetical protein [Zoogloeaceae bacterium]
MRTIRILEESHSEKMDVKQQLVGVIEEIACTELTNRTTSNCNPRFSTEAVDNCVGNCLVITRMARGCGEAGALLKQ